MTKGRTSIVLLCSVIGLLALLPLPTSASADTIGYLVNVTVRPGYHFDGAEEALAYGYEVCDEVRQGRTYTQMAARIKTDFATNDDYQASYLIGQSVDELCPNLIWQLRQTAAGDVPSTPGGHR